MAVEITMEELNDLLARYHDAEIAYLQRNWRIEGWRQTYTLDGRYDEPEAGRINLTTNLPYTVVRLATAMMSRHQPYLARPYIDTVADRERSSRIEQFCYAGLRETDRLAILRGHDLFRHELAQMVNIDGWIALQAMLDPDTDDSGSLFDTYILDPIDCFPEISSRTEAIFCRYRSNAKRVAQQYGITLALDDNEPVYYLACWQWKGKAVWHTAMLIQGGDPSYFAPSGGGTTIMGLVDHAGRPIKKTPRYGYFNKYTTLDVLYHGKTNLRDLPVIVMPVGGVHWRQSNFGYLQAGSRWPMTNEDEHGHSLLYSIDHLLADYNDLVSSIRELVEAYIHPTVVVKTPTGRIKEVKLGRDAVNYFANNESLEVVYVQGSPPPFADVLRMVERMMDEATLPAAIRGVGMEQASSGFLLSVLDNQALNHLVRGVNSMDAARQQMMRLWLRQYERMGRKADKFKYLWGTDSAGAHFFNQARPEDVAGFYDVAVDSVLGTAQHQIAQMNYVTMGKQAGIFSAERGREILMEPNPARENSRIIKESVQNNPAIQLAEALQLYIAEGREAAASALAGQLGVNYTAGAKREVRNPRTGLPARRQPRPEALPPAASQGQPNPQVATAAGQGAAGYGGTDTEAGRSVIERLGL